MAKLLLGKEVTAAMNEKLQARVAALKEKGVSPKLAIVRCGENPSTPRASIKRSMRRWKHGMRWPHGLKWKSTSCAAWTMR